MSEARAAAAAGIANEPATADPIEVVRQVAGEDLSEDSECGGFGSDVSD